MNWNSGERWHFETQNEQHHNALIWVVLAWAVPVVGTLVWVWLAHPEGGAVMTPEDPGNFGSNGGSNPPKPSH